MNLRTKALSKLHIKKVQLAKVMREAEEGKNQTHTI